MLLSKRLAAGICRQIESVYYSFFLENKLQRICYKPIVIYYTKHLGKYFILGIKNMIILKRKANLSAEIATRFHAVHVQSPKEAFAHSWQPKPGTGKSLNQIENV